MIREVYGIILAKASRMWATLFNRWPTQLKNVGVTPNEAIVGATEKAIALRDAFRVTRWRKA